MANKQQKRLRKQITKSIRVQREKPRDGSPSRFKVSHPMPNYERIATNIGDPSRGRK